MRPSATKPLAALMIAGAAIYCAQPRAAQTGEALAQSAALSPSMASQFHQERAFVTGPASARGMASGPRQ